MKSCSDKLKVSLSEYSAAEENKNRLLEEYDSIQNNFKITEDKYGNLKKVFEKSAITFRETENRLQKIKQKFRESLDDILDFSTKAENDGLVPPSIRILSDSFEQLERESENKRF